VPVHLQRHRQVRRRLREARPQGHVWSPYIVVRYPLLEDAPQVIFRQWNQVIQALSPQRAQEPFAERIRLGTVRWGFEHSQAQVAHLLIELRGEDTVPVMEQKAVGVIRAIRS
jgi:hypothetical protein